MNLLKFAAFLAMICIVAGFEITKSLEAKQFSISSQIVEFIEEAKKQMPCGFPSLGIPPLAPLSIKNQPISLENDNLQLKGSLENLRLDGLHDFDIVDFHLNVIKRKLDFKFVWKHLNLSTAYNMQLKTGVRGLPLNSKHNGMANIALRGLRISGEGKYKWSLLSNKVTLKEAKIYVSIDSVRSDIEGLVKNKFVNRMLNNIIEELIMLAVNDNTEYFAENSNEYLVPIVNVAIGDKTLSELMDFIDRVGGRGAPKEPCIPNADSNSKKVSE